MAYTVQLIHQKYVTDVKSPPDPDKHYKPDSYKMPILHDKT